VETRSIDTSVGISSCDVCGRTLLRGEHAEVYVGGGSRHSVCSLCTSRAVHTGWVREGTLPDYDPDAKVDRRRSLLSRLRSRREHAGSTLAAPDGHVDNHPGQPLAPTPPPVRAEPPAGAVTQRSAPREPRHVRAVPTSIEHRTAAAVELFNTSEHPRTVAGIGRSLGVPEVSVLPAAKVPSMVSIVIAWELCWYRYEVDLSDEVPSVRVAAQGYELDELAPEERRRNADADERGVLTLVR
jgi:hypothetical protein